MKLRKLGKSDVEITPVMMGTWALGGWLWGGTEKNNAAQAIKASIDAGINCIDTAPVYGFGLSEELVGKAIRGRRDELVIATKCGLVWDGRKGSTPYFETKDNRGDPIMVSRCLRRESIIRECDQSLQRLGIDTIDLYQCHWPDTATPMEEPVEAFLELREKGKIHAFGVSNFSTTQIEEWIQLGPLDCSQPKYSLLSREIESEVLPFCKKNEVGVICYSPMEMGILTGKIGMDKVFPDDDTRKNRPWFQPKKRREVLDALEIIRPIARNHNATLGHIAIAWAFHQPGVTAAIVGARDGDQARVNAEAANIALSADDLISIKAAFAPLKLDAPFDSATAKR